MKFNLFVALFFVGPIKAVFVGIFRGKSVFHGYKIVLNTRFT